MRAFKQSLTLGTLTLMGMAATIIVRGGWQAAAAAFAIACGGGFALTFAALGAASERPRSHRPGWAQPAHRSTQGSLRPSRVAATRPERPRARTSGRQPLAPRPASSA
jgi:hypothetical protein